MKLVQKLAVAYVRTKLRMLSMVSEKQAARKALDLFCTPQSRVRKKMPPIFSQAEKLSFVSGSNKLIGYRWNAGGSKTLLIIHGFESSVINFDRYIKPFMRKNYIVIAFDAPAHGKSAGKKITAPMYAKMITDIDRRYGPVNFFIAHSFGCLALSLALEQMDDHAGRKAVFIAPATESTTAVDSFFKFLQLKNGIRTEFDQLIKKMSGNETKWFSIPRVLKHIRTKILWMHDKDDDITPISDVKKVEDARHAHVTFHFTEGLGHRRIYRDNKVTKAVIDFLQ